MVCMKCGKETKNERVFCARCLEVMEAYPVKPDVIVQLPSHNPEAAPKKQSRKIRIDPKDAQIIALRRQLRLMWLLVIALLLALGLLMAREYCLPDAEPTEPTSSYTEPTT